MAQQSETAEVPFDFHVGKSTMPAGTYTVNRDGLSSFLQLRSDDTRHGVLMLIQGRANGKNDPRMVFRCYSGDCFLSEIWIPGAPGYSFDKTSREKEVEKSGTRVAMAYVPMATR